MKFENVKINDCLLMEHRPGFGPSSYHEAVVIKVTNTRFTVSYSGREKVFTKDGYEYPRATGYSRSYTELKLMDDIGKSLIRKQRLTNKARLLAGKLDDIFGNANYRERIISQDLDEKEIEENIALLENVYERLKKYGPKEK